MTAALALIDSLDPRVWALVTFVTGVLFGALVGHRFAIGRDKRKERLELVAPLYAGIEKWLERPAVADVPTAVQLDALIPYMSRRAHHRLVAGVAAYGRACREQQRQDEAGGVHYADEEHIRTALLAIKAALPKR